MTPRPETRPEAAPASRRGRTAVLWTGGKDSFLAMRRAQDAGIRIDELVTFAPTRARFRAHPLRLMRAQARSLRIPHRIERVSAPYRVGYERAIQRLAEHGFATLVTGDIDAVHGRPNWISERAVGSGVRVVRPLWKSDRDELLTELLRRRIQAVVSAARLPFLAPGWVGRRLDARAIRELRDLARRTGFDACGEQGEYHSMVLDGPGFEYPVRVGAWTVARYHDLSYLRLRPSTADLAHRPRRDPGARRPTHS